MSCVPGQLYRICNLGLYMDSQITWLGEGKMREGELKKKKRWWGFKFGAEDLTWASAMRREEN